MAFSAGLSIAMTVFVFPFLHRRLPENLFLRLCVFGLIIVRRCLRDRPTRLSCWGLVLPLRMVLQLQLELASPHQCDCHSLGPDGVTSDGRLRRDVSSG